MVLCSTHVFSSVQKAHEESAFKHLCGVEFEKHLKPRQTKLGLPRFVRVNLNQLLNFF